MQRVFKAVVVLRERREEQRGGGNWPSLHLPVSTSIYSQVSPGRRRQHRQHFFH
jgi:hypothetical protein